MYVQARLPLDHIIYLFQMHENTPEPTFLGIKEEEVCMKSIDKLHKSTEHLKA